MLSRVIVLFISAVFVAAHAQGKEEAENKVLGRDLTEWRQMYFIGISKGDPDEIDLSEFRIKGLLSMVNVEPVICTGAAIRPEFLANKKRFSVWQAMFALTYGQNLLALTAIAQRKSGIYIPNHLVRDNFNSHNNWPLKWRAKYDIKLEGYNTFVIPFLIHNSAEPVSNLSQSLKAQDGSMEIFNVNEFKEESPEQLLARIEKLMVFIKENRPDITQAN